MPGERDEYGTLAFPAPIGRLAAQTRSVIVEASGQAPQGATTGNVPEAAKAFPGRILLPTSAGPGYLPVKPRIQRASAGVASGRPSSKAMRAMRATSSAFDAALRPGA